MSYKLNACKKYLDENQKYLDLHAKNGWTIDRFGHAKKIINGKEYRIKFQHHTIRREVKVVHDTGSVKSEWVRLQTYDYNGQIV